MARKLLLPWLKTGMLLLSLAGVWLWITTSQALVPLSPPSVTEAGVSLIYIGTPTVVSDTLFYIFLALPGVTFVLAVMRWEWRGHWFENLAALLFMTAAYTGFVFFAYNSRADDLVSFRRTPLLQLYYGFRFPGRWNLDLFPNFYPYIVLALISSILFLALVIIALRRRDAWMAWGAFFIPVSFSYLLILNTITSRMTVLLLRMHRIDTWHRADVMVIFIGVVYLFLIALSILLRQAGSKAGQRFLISVSMALITGAVFVFDLAEQLSILAAQMG